MYLQGYTKVLITSVASRGGNYGGWWGEVSLYAYPLILSEF